MPPLKWTREPTELIRLFETRHYTPASGALFSWAAWAVEGLHYLDDIDRAYDCSHATIGGHSRDVVDVAHARWATATCITALDLCAAGLGHAFCGHKRTLELDIGYFDPSGKPSKQKVALRAKLPPPARQWVDDVCADPKYRQLKDARDWLTHSRVKRHFTLAAGGPPQRLQLELATKVEVRQLVEGAWDFATRHVSAFLELLPRL